MIKNLLLILNGLFKPKDKSALILNIGKFKRVLLPSAVFTYVNGRPSSFITLRWRRKRGKAVIRPASEPNPHIIVFGMSGQGKSTLLRSLVRDIARSRLPVIIFDAHNEYDGIVRSLGGNVIDAVSSGLNIFALEGSSVGDRIAELVSLLGKVYSLGYLQSMKLGECMWYAYRKCGAGSRSDMQLPKAPSFSDVISELNIFIRNAKTVSEKNSLMHMYTRLAPFAFQAPKGKNFDIEELMHGVSSFSLANLKSTETQAIYINELLRRLYIGMKSKEKEKGVSLYLVIDEAQFIISDTDSQIVKKLTEEGRKYGVGIILATHMASRIPKEIVANASTFITFYPREPQEINYVTSIMSSGISSRAEEIKKMLMRLRQNEAMVLSYFIREPSVVATPKAQNMPSGATAGSYNLPRPIRIDKEQDKWPSDLSNKQGLDIVWKGSREHWIMDKNKSLSIEHEVYVRKIFEELSSAGIKSVIVDNSSGPDLIAYSNGKRIAIEYETGKKSLKSTSAMISKRIQESDFVVIVVNDQAFQFYQNYFEGNNLIIIAASSISRISSIIATL